MKYCITMQNLIWYELYQFLKTWKLWWNYWFLYTCIALRHKNNVWIWLKNCKCRESNPLVIRILLSFFFNYTIKVFMFEQNDCWIIHRISRLETDHSTIELQMLIHIILSNRTVYLNCSKSERKIKNNFDENTQWLFVLETLSYTHRCQSPHSEWRLCRSNNIFDTSSSIERLIKQ